MCYLCVLSSPILTNLVEGRVLASQASLALTYEEEEDKLGLELGSADAQMCYLIVISLLISCDN